MMQDREGDNHDRQSSQESSNPTLKEAGASVSDYGNVTGDSSNKLQEESGAISDDQENTSIAPDEED